MGQREQLSEKDLNKIRSMYKCQGNYKPAATTSSPNSNKPATTTGSSPNKKPAGGGVIGVAGSIFSGLGNIIGSFGKGDEPQTM